MFGHIYHHRARNRRINGRSKPSFASATSANLAQGVTRVNSVRFELSPDETAGPDDRATAYQRTVQKNTACANPHIILNDDSAPARLKSLFTDRDICAFKIMVCRCERAIRTDQNASPNLHTVPCRSW
jgi:hypothetical protein